MQFSFLTSEEIDDLHLRSIDLLQKVGVRICNKRALRTLADAGAQVEFQSQRVRVPASLIDEGVRKAKKSFPLHGRRASHNLRLEEGRAYVHPSGGHTYVMDLKTRRRMEATSADVGKFTILVNSLQHLACCSMIVSPHDIPPEVRDIGTAKIILECSEKHLIVNPYRNVNLNYILKLAQVVAGTDELGKRPIITIALSPSSPLQYSGEVAAMLMNTAERRLPLSIMPSPIAGATSPITMAGTLMQQNAEILVGNLIAQLVKPRTPIIYSPRAAIMDPWKGTPMYRHVNSRMMAAAAVQLAKRYGFISSAGFSFLSALSGANLLDGAGGLSDGLTASFERLMVDNRRSEIIHKLLHGIRVDEATLAQDVISRVGPGGHFLVEQHTRDFLKSAAKYNISGKLTRTDLTKEITKILAEHKTTCIDKGFSSELEAVLSEAMKRLCK